MTLPKGNLNQALFKNLTAFVNLMTLPKGNYNQALFEHVTAFVCYLRTLGGNNSDNSQQSMDNCRGKLMVVWLPT